MVSAALRESAIICDASSMLSEASCAMTCMTMFIIICMRRMSFCSSAISSGVGDTTVGSIWLGSCCCSMRPRPPLLSHYSCWMRAGGLCVGTSVGCGGDWLGLDGAVGVEQEGGEAELVGAVETCAARGDTVDDLAAWMAEGFAAADGDDGVLRRESGEEGRGSGGAAAVVTDLEQRDGREAVGKHCLFAGSFGVSFE